MEQTKDMILTPDTGVQENTPPHPDDAQQTASGNSRAPGGSAAPARSDESLTHGQSSYPGPRPGDADETPAAGDVDPASTAASDETGQAGDLSATQQDPQKNKANAWNG